MRRQDKREVRRRHMHDRSERPILQHEGENRPVHARHRPRSQGNAGMRRAAARQADTRRNRRSTALVQGTAMPEHLRRRRELSRTIRVRIDTGDGKGDESHHKDMPAYRKIQRLSRHRKIQTHQTTAPTDSKQTLFCSLNAVGSYVSPHDATAGNNRRTGR